MPRRIDHVAVIVRNLKQALSFYRDTLGIEPSEIKDVPTEQVRIAFLPLGGLGGSQIELIEPLGDTSPLTAFLAKNPLGGQHHVCFEVPDIAAARDWFEAQGKRVPTFLWEDRGVIPFLKIDKGLEAEKDGVSLMKPIPGLDALLGRAVKLGVFGTKMRSVINLASKDGIVAVVAQQFAVAAQVSAQGLTPIIEPEVSIKSPAKAAAEALLLAELTKHLDALPSDRKVMLKLTIPETPDFYSALASHDRVARVVALSGGYTRDEACRRLAANHGMIASFSRALAEDLKASMSDAEFDAALARSIDEIYRASTVKR